MGSKEQKIDRIYGNRIRIRVCGILIQNEKILLVNHSGLTVSNTFWSPPGGGLKYGESVIQCLEREFLEERAEELGLPKDEISQIIANADKLEFVVPEDEEDREEQLADFVFMSMVDGNIEDKEYQLCLNIAERLELKKEDLDEVIALTQRLWNQS